MPIIKLPLIAASAGLTALLAVCHSWSGNVSGPLSIPPALAASQPVAFVEGSDAEPPSWPPPAQAAGRNSPASIAAALEPAAGPAFVPLSPVGENNTAAEGRPATVAATPPKAVQRHHHPKNAVTFARAKDGAIVPIVWNR